MVSQWRQGKGSIVPHFGRCNGIGSQWGKVSPIQRILTVLHRISIVVEQHGSMHVDLGKVFGIKTDLIIILIGQWLPVYSSRTAFISSGSQLRFVQPPFLSPLGIAQDQCSRLIVGCGIEIGNPSTGACFIKIPTHNVINGTVIGCHLLVAIHH